MKILVTAFDPFGQETINPAAQAVKALPKLIANANIITAEIPTVFGESIAHTLALIHEHQPDAVLCVGQAGGRAAITPERVAINIDDARIPDNAGHTPVDQPIAAHGPAAYFATLPIKAMVQAIRDAGQASALSNTAGTFVCNHLMYGVLHHLATTGRAHVRAGFIHVPFLPEQVADKPGQPSMSCEDIAHGLEAAIAAIVAHREDLRLSEGATH